MNVADICKVAPQSANVDKMASNTVVFGILLVNILVVSLLKCLLNHSENVHRTTIYNFFPFHQFNINTKPETVFSHGLRSLAIKRMHKTKIV